MISIEECLMNRQYKKALTILLLLMAVLMLSSATKSPYFTKSVIITRVYPHKLGFKVLYMSNELKNKVVYLPNEIFSVGNDGSDIIYGHDKAYPYMMIFWKDGEFSHVKLFLKQDINDVTWGSLNDPDAHDKNFDPENIEFDF